MSRSSTSPGASGGASLVLALAALACGLPFAGCFGTETGNPPFSPEVGYGGHEPMGLAPDPIVDAARVSMDEVRAVDCAGIRVPMLRRVLVDFATGVASVGEVVDLPAGTYCGIELAVAACSDPELCRTVAPESISIDATRRLDAAPVVIRDSEPLTVVLEGEPFELGPDEGAVLLALDLNLLVAGLSIGTAPVGGDGAIHVDSTSDPTRLAAIRTGLGNAMALYRDMDGDTLLDEAELLAPALATPPAP